MRIDTFVIEEGIMSEYIPTSKNLHGVDEKQYKIDQYINWGAGRAAVLALSPKFSALALCANAAYMVTRIASLHGVEIRKGAVTGLVTGLATALAAAAASLLVPVKAIRIPAAVALTYAIGKVANQWIEDGMPTDISRYKPMLEEWFNNGKALASSLAAAGYTMMPEKAQDVWDGIENEATYAVDRAKDKYEKHVVPAKEKWDKETKYVVHDKAAETVAKVSDTVSSVASKASDVANTAATAATNKAAATVENVQNKVSDAKEAVTAKVDAVNAKVAKTKESLQDTVATVQASAEVAKDMAVVAKEQVKETISNKLGK